MAIISIKNFIQASINKVLSTPPRKIIVSDKYGRWGTKDLIILKKLVDIHNTFSFEKRCVR